MKGSMLETVRKPVVAKIGLIGLAIRGQSLRAVTLGAYARFILKRCNNPAPSVQVRSSETSMVPWDKDLNSLQIVPLRKGTVIPFGSDVWKSKGFGTKRLDLQLTFSGLDPNGEKLSRQSLVEIFRDRLLGRGGSLPDHVDISFLEGAVERKYPKINYELKHQYITEYPRPVLSGSDLPMIADEERMQELFEAGGFSDLMPEPATTLQNVAFAISILPAHWQDIISSLYGIDRDYVETSREIGKRLEYSGGEIGKHKKRILEYFNKLNSDRNNYLWSTRSNVDVPV